MNAGLSDSALRHLRRVADWPDLSGTRYAIEAELGRGGMGTVYQARDHTLDRPVALKVMSLPGGGAALLRRLEREAKVLALLEHPGIVPVHDAGTLHDGRVFYTMKLVRGRRLDEVVGGGLSLQERLRLFLRVADTVAFAHSRGVLHRDLKPENIMVGAFGEVLVLDWGIAKVRGDDENDEDDASPPADPLTPDPRGPTRAGTVLGTPGYMSPEQAMGSVELVDERSDVFALGALLRFLVSGRRPEGDGDRTAEEVSTPKRLAAVIRMATASRREDRYPSVAAVAEDLARYLDGAPMAAYRERWWERVARVAEKYRTAILLVVAYLIIRLLLLYFRR